MSNIPCAGTFLLMFNNSLWESSDLAPTSTASWTQEPFPAGGPQGITALGTVGGTAWVLDSVAPPTPLWLRVDKNTYVQLKAANLPGTPLITSDLSPDRVDFYTTPFLIPPFIRFLGPGSNIVCDIGVSGGQTQQMYALSTDGGQTAQLLSYGNLPFPTGSKLMRFWGDERGTYPSSPSGLLPFFMAQVRQPSPPPPATPDFLYGGSFPNLWNTTPLLQAGTPVGGGASVQQIRDDFIRKQNFTYLASVILTTGLITIVRSTDGVNWAPATIPANALTQPGLVECDNGTVLVPTIQPTPGFVLRSTDDGQSFQSSLTISGVNSANIFLKYFPGLDVLFALVQVVGGGGPFGAAVYMSVDQGQTWAQVFTSATGTSGFLQQATSWMAVTGPTPPGTQLLNTQNMNCSPVSKSPSIIFAPPAPGSASAPYLGKFFFYSNNPENITVGGTTYTADNKTQPYWLLQETVRGSGRVFIWHGNNVSAKLNSELLIHNPNTVSITVAATGGAVPLMTKSVAGGAGNGVDAWFALFNGISAPISPSGPIPAGGFATVFTQSGLPLNNPFGIVADLSITGPGNTPAQAILFDVAWESKFDPATLIAKGKQSGKDGSPTRVRGLAAPANGYWIPVDLNPFSLNNILQGGPQGVTVAAGSPGTNDAFNGTDAPFITDPDGSQTRLVGDYGAQLCFSFPVANDDTRGIPHGITIYAGNLNTGPTNFAIFYSGPGGCDNLGSGELARGHYLPILQDSVPKFTTVTYRFQIVTIGAYSTPLTVWVEVTT